MSNRYDVIYTSKQCYIQPHFCREWDEDGGCYGTNPYHGFTFEEAKREVINYYQLRIGEIQEATEDPSSSNRIWGVHTGD